MYSALIGMLFMFVVGIKTFGGCVTVSVLIHCLVAVMYMRTEALFMFQKTVGVYPNEFSLSFVGVLFR